MLTVKEIDKKLRAVMTRLNRSPRERITEEEYQLWRLTPRGYARPPWREYFTNLSVSQWPPESSLIQTK